MFDEPGPIDGDATGDINDFWNDRDYNKDVSKVKAAVFESHGINDDNVRPDQMSRWWTGLAANNVPRKLWLSLEGHVDPFEYRRTEWVNTLHRWFDYWLQGVQNGIMNEPRVDIETSADTFTTYADWPIPGTTPTDVFLGGRGAGKSGTLLLGSGGDNDSLAFTDNSLSENNALSTPNGSQANRLTFLTTKLKSDLHLSGTPMIDLQASLSTPQSNLAALLVDYGPADHTGRGGSDGVSNTNPAVKTCFGDSTAADSACYTEVTKPTQAVTQWRVSKGILDSSNRDSLFTAEQRDPGPEVRVQVPDPADGVHVPGRSPGRRRPAGQLLDGRRQHARRGGHGRHQGQQGHPPDHGRRHVRRRDRGLRRRHDDPDHRPGSGEHQRARRRIRPAPPSPTRRRPRPTRRIAAPTVTCSKASGTKFVVGTTTVTCTAADANGNAAADTRTFTVTVVDITTATGDVGGTVRPRCR